MGYCRAGDNDVNVSMHLEGLDRLRGKLRRLPDKAQSRVQRSAIGAAATKVRRALINAAPQQSSEQRDARNEARIARGRKPWARLRDAVGRKVRKGRRTGDYFGVVGVDSREAPHGHMLEVTTKLGHKDWGSKAIASVESAALEKMAERMLTSLQREFAKL